MALVRTEPKRSHIANGAWDHIAKITFSNVVIFGSLLDPVIQFERESQPKIKTPLKSITYTPASLLGWGGITC